MVSIIVMLEDQIAKRLETARQEIRAGGDSDRALDLALADIRKYCGAVDHDVQLMVNSGW